MGRSVLAVCALCALVALAAGAATLDIDQQQHYNAVDITADFTPPKQVPQVPSVPLNERFPSAVVFGGACGGTILSERWILSAAHCTLFDSGLSVEAGFINSGDNSEHQSQFVKNLYIHPLFTVGPHSMDASRFDIKEVAPRYDFLLAELEEPLTLNDKTIVAASLDGANVTPGQNVGFAGYVADYYWEPTRYEMHGISLSVLPNADCARLQQYNENEMLCARGVPPTYDSICKVNSGSGLMLGKQVVGVASWMENDDSQCRNESMVVFARVSIARDWIRNITGL